MNQKGNKKTLNHFTLCAVNFVLLHCFLLFMSIATLAAQKTPVRRIKECKRIIGPAIGTTIEKTIVGINEDCYLIKLDRDVFIKFSVQSISLSLSGRIIGPDSKLLVSKSLEMDSGSPESLACITESSGDHRIEIRQSEKLKESGRYFLKIIEIGQPSSKDRDRISGEKLDEEARKLMEERTKESYLKAIEKYIEALKYWHSSGEKNEEAATTGAIGELYCELGELEKGLNYYDQAVKIFREIGNQTGEAVALGNIGGVFQTRGDGTKALEYYEKALPLARTVKDAKTEALVLNNQGLLYKEKGENEKAVEFFKLSLQAAKLDNNLRGQCYTLVSLGTLFDAISNLQEALNYYNQALPLIRKINERGLEATTLTNLGKIYDKLGDRTRAYELYTQALTMARKVGNLDIELYALKNLGGFYRDSGENEKAIRYFEDSIKLAQRFGSRNHEANAKHNLGRVYLGLNNIQKAIALFNESLSISREVKNPFGEASSLYGLGDSFEKSGNSQKALEYLNQALTIKRQINDRSGEADILFSISRAKREMGNYNDARTHIEDAVGIVENLTESVKRLDLRASYFAKLHVYYEFDIDLLMRMHEKSPSFGYDSYALQASDRARARNLLALLAESKIDTNKDIDPSLQSQRAELQAKIKQKEKTKFDLLAAKSGASAISKIDKEIEELLDSYRNVEAQIRQKNPQFANLKLDVMSVSEIQKLLDSDTLLLQYALGEKKSFLWVVSQTDVKSFALPSKQVIEDLAFAAYGFLSQSSDPVRSKTPPERGLKRAFTEPEYLKTVNDLARTIIGPVFHLLEAKRLIIVSDGLLQFIPFSALPEPDHSNQPRESITEQVTLVDKHEIINLPSATALAAIRNNKAGQEYDRSIVAFVDPVFEADDPRLIESISKRDRSSSTLKNMTASTRTMLLKSAKETGAISRGTSLQRLIYTEDEAKTIEELVKDNIIVYRGLAAKKENVASSRAGGYQVVHFATHGLVNTIHPELSGIVLSLFDEKGKPMDGFLRLIDLYNLRLPADLVVLSACQTAVGKQVKGEGLEALTRGFMQAGATRVIATLWKVDDEATARFMGHFYQALLGRRLRPAAALQEAQRELRREKRWKSPRFWSGFVIQGEWR